LDQNLSGDVCFLDYREPSDPFIIFFKESRKALLALALKDIPLDDTVDLDKIAGLLTNYSGADVTSLCRDAALMSMRRMIKNKSPNEIRQLSKDDIEKPVTQEDFIAAIERSSTTVQESDLTRHEKWIKQFGSY
jgi:katanin p60 ATPase-containing subunit A1